MEYFVWPLIRSGVGGQKSEPWKYREIPQFTSPAIGDIVSVTPCLLESPSLGSIGSIFLELTVLNAQAKLLWDVNMETYMQYLT
jgi:hypothetical protein